MATNITIEDNQGRTLSITSANPTIEEKSDSGSRIFSVAYPYNLSPTPKNNPEYYTPGKANVNGDALSGRTIMVVETKGIEVQIHVRG